MMDNGLREFSKILFARSDMGITPFLISKRHLIINTDKVRTIRCKEFADGL